jgi:hypothetical protein
MENYYIYGTGKDNHHMYRHEWRIWFTIDCHIDHHYLHRHEWRVWITIDCHIDHHHLHRHEWRVRRNQNHYFDSDHKSLLYWKAEYGDFVSELHSGELFRFGTSIMVSCGPPRLRSIANTRSVEPFRIPSQEETGIWPTSTSLLQYYYQAWILLAQRHYGSNLQIHSDRDRDGNLNHDKDRGIRKRCDHYRQGDSDRYKDDRGHKDEYPDPIGHRRKL